MIQHLFEFYTKIYRLRTKISKQDRHGIYTKLDALSLDAITFALTAKFESGPEKIPTLKKLRIAIEILKRIIRLTEELHIIGKELYFDLEQHLQEISKETNGWIKHLEQKSPQRAFL